MVVSHPCEKFVFDALPPQPFGLSTHGKRIPDLANRIHDGATRQRANDFVSDSPDTRLEFSHALRREERINGRPKCRVFWRVQGVGHLAMG